MSSAKWAAALALMFALGNHLLLADDDDRDRGRGGGMGTFEAQLLRMAEVNTPVANQPLGPAFTPNGADPLDDGSVEVREGGGVEVRLRGAAPSQAYSVFFCRFGFGPPCLAVGAIGALMTDSRGDGRASLDFPQPATGPNGWAGVFVLTRVVSTQPTNEFVSGFRIRPATVNPNRTDLEVQGMITSINAANQSFRIGTLQQDIFTDNATEFRGRVRQFSDLAVGLPVEVKARTAADGRLFARELEGKGGDDDKGHDNEPPRRRGRGRD